MRETMCFIRNYDKDSKSNGLSNMFKGASKFFTVLKNDVRTIDEIYEENNMKKAQLVKGMLDTNALSTDKVLGNDSNEVNNKTAQ